MTGVVLQRRVESRYCAERWFAGDGLLRQEGWPASRAKCQHGSTSCTGYSKPCSGYSGYRQPWAGNTQAEEIALQHASEIQQAQGFKRMELSNSTTVRWSCRAYRVVELDNRTLELSGVWSCRTRQPYVGVVGRMELSNSTTVWSCRAQAEG